MRGIGSVILDRGREQVQNVLRDIELENAIRQDMVARPDVVKHFFANRTVKVADKEFGLTDWSFNQLLGRATVPRSYYDRMVKTNNGELAETNVNTMIKVGNEDGLMFRTVNGNVKGILSPSYKRMDASVVFQAFASSSLKQGYLPYVAHNTDSRYNLKFVKDEVIPVGKDEVVFGLSMTTSDYGASSLSISMFVLRLICLNGMVGIDMFRKVHLGKRFVSNFDDNGIVLSDRTEQLDALTLGSGIDDVLKQAYKYEGDIKNAILTAQGESPNIKKILEELRKKGKVGKELGARIANLYDSDGVGVEALPKEKTLWRFSNVISLLAKEYEGDTKLELEETAADVLRIA